MLFNYAPKINLSLAYVKYLVNLPKAESPFTKYPLVYIIFYLRFVLILCETSKGYLLFIAFVPVFI